MTNCQNTTCRTLQEQGLEPLDHNGCPDRQEGKKRANDRLELAVKNLKFFLSSPMPKEQIIEEMTEEMTQLANQKLKEGMERTIKKLTEEIEEKQYGLDIPWVKGWNDCRAAMMFELDAIREEIEKLTQPKK